MSIFLKCNGLFLINKIIREAGSKVILIRFSYIYIIFLGDVLMLFRVRESDTIDCQPDRRIFLGTLMLKEGEMGNGHPLLISSGLSTVLPYWRQIQNH